MPRDIFVYRSIFISPNSSGIRDNMIPPLRDVTPGLPNPLYDLEYHDPTIWKTLDPWWFLLQRLPAFREGADCSA